MNILFLSSHEILEANLIRLWLESGHKVFSMGAFQTNSKGSGIRSEIEGLYLDPHLVAISHQCSKHNIHPELIEWSDVVISMHNSVSPTDTHPQPWIKYNFDNIKKAGKPFIWYSIGQSTQVVEESLAPFRSEGLKIVRYSPFEKNIPGYIGEDAMIRFSCDEDEFKGYIGSVSRITNISQAMFGNDRVPSRGSHMAFDTFKQVVDDFDWKVFGPDNENAGEHNGGLLSYEDLKTMLRLSRIYFYVGTRPASYTLGFQEALMTGIPVVSIGHDLGNAIYKQKTFEVPELIGENKVSGFWSDNILELKEYCRELLNDYELAKQVGMRGRERAIELFGKDKIRDEWERFFSKL